MRSIFHCLLGSTLAISPLAAQSVVPARPVPEPAPPEIPVAPARPVEIGPDGRPMAPDTPVVPPAPVAPAEPFLAPDPANDLIKFADELFGRNEFELAMTRYDQFIVDNPRHPLARKALYQLAECLRRLNRLDDAEQAYALLVDRYKTGEFVDVSAYRAAGLAYNRRDYRSAVPYFKIARLLGTKPQFKLDATFRAARCYELSGESRLAAPLFREIIQSPDAGEFKEPSMLALARQSLTEGKKEESLGFFLDLATNAKDATVRAESLVRAALIETDLKRDAEAEKHYLAVFKLPEAEPWKPVAQLGLIRGRYQRKDYQGVIDAYTAGVYKLADDMRVQMFLMVGHSFQRLGKLQDAVKVYGILENFAPGQPEGFEAGYRRLECLYLAKDDNLPAFVDSFVETEKKAGRNHKFLDRAMLLKAETLFGQKNPVAAAPAYAAIRMENIPEQQRPTALYKHGWAEAEAGRRPQAVEALGRFLTLAPNDSRVPLALAKRGEMYALNGDPARASQDFTTVTEKFPDSEAAEFAYVRAARLHADQNDTQTMIRLYNGLLEKFPQSKAAPDAHYALGRAYYQTKKYDLAVEHLRKARDLDAELYARSAGSRLVLSCYALRDAAALRKELDTFLQVAKASELPPQVPAWLGVKLYEEGDAAAADDYLTMSANEQDPKATEPVIWKFLAKARLDAGRFAAAVRAADHYLATTEDAAARASGSLDKARAQFGLRAFADADTTAMEGQKIVRQGKTNAWLGILRGDIAAAQDKWDEAVKHYIVPSQTMVDSEITPLALWKTSQALQRAGQRDEAKKFRAEIETRFPLFQAPQGPLVPKAEREERGLPNVPLPTDLPDEPTARPGEEPPLRPLPGGQPGATVVAPPVPEPEPELPPVGIPDAGENPPEP
ncbi:MAG: tetratricopeptide repeat protein [Verrucomicrobiales bacterium]